MVDSKDTGSGTPTSLCVRLADPRKVSRAENLERVTLPYDASLGVVSKDVLGAGDGFEVSELPEVMVPGVSIPLAPFRYVWEEDATGEYITLAEVSGPLDKAQEVTEATVVLDWSKAGGKNSCLVSCFRGVRELSLRPFAS